MLSCGGTVRLDVRLVTRTCGGPDPLEGASHLGFTVYGEGLTPTRWRLAITAAATDLPVFAAGKDRNLVVEALAGDAVVGRGETGPMDLTVMETPARVDVFVRGVDAFTPTGTREGSATCVEMLHPRAGHTATLLGDGRVLVAGGFRLTGTSPQYVGATEIFDPRTGLFSPGPDLRPPRAFHSATHLPGTTLTVLAGGKFDDSYNAALRLVDVFDEKTNAFTTTALTTSRVRHAAAVSATSGRLVVIGGYSVSADGHGLVPLKTTEVFDSKTLQFSDGPALAGPRAGVSAAALSDGRVVVAGGWDGANTVGRVDYLAPSGATYTFEQTGAAAGVKRTVPLVAPLGGGGAVIGGGFTDQELTSTDTVEVAQVGSGTVSTAGKLSSRRGDGGVVALPDGTALMGGGARVDAGGRRASLEDADVVSPREGGLVAVSPVRGRMRDARYQAAWTLLRDGSVLATGGISADGRSDAKKVLSSAEVYQPHYQTSLDGPYR